MLLPPYIILLEAVTHYRQSLIINRDVSIREKNNECEIRGFTAADLRARVYQNFFPRRDPRRFERVIQLRYA